MRIRDRLRVIWTVLRLLRPFKRMPQMFYSVPGGPCATGRYATRLHYLRETAAPQVGSISIKFPNYGKEIDIHGKPEDIELLREGLLLALFETKFWAPPKGDTA